MNKEEAINILKGAIKKPNTKDGYLGQALTMGIEALENQKTGHWICSKDVYETGVCSVCKREVGELFEYVKKFYNYCPYCGAELKGE